MDSHSQITDLDLSASRKISKKQKPLQPRDLNGSKTMDVVNLKPSSALDTPPPSSPISASDSAVRGHRSSSVTALYSSSPSRPANDDPSSSPAPGASPTKPFQSRVSFGSSYAAEKLARDDPFAGLEELAGKDGAEEDVTHVLYASYTHALMLGRCKPSGAAHASSAAGSQQDDDDSIVASQGVGSKPLQHVSLPNSARHVSRRHAIIEWVPFSPLVRAADASEAAKRLPVGGFVVRILGQNGLIVEGKRRREGHVLRLHPGKTILDFFGVKARFDVREEAQKPLSLIESQASKERVASSKRKARASLPQSDGSSPSKKAALRRTASTSSMRESQEAVSQMLLPISAKSTSQLVKKSTLGRDSQFPMSPPSSSPPPLDAQSKDDNSLHPDNGQGEADDDDGAEEPMSPTLGRSRLSAISRLGKDLDSAGGESDLENRLPSKSRKLAGKAVESIDLKSSLAEDSEHPLSDVDSDLTPSPSPSRVTIPSTSAGDMPPPTTIPVPRAARSLALTSSQTRMPPPKLPASATLTSTGTKDSHELFRGELREHARRCIAALAPTYDLEGLLAGAIVFHRTATISASEAVRSVLSCNQGLMRGEVGSISPDPACASPTEQLEHGKIVPGWGAEDLLVTKAGLSPAAAAERWTSIARRAWTEQLETVLQSKRMFGQIQRAGKDASGNSLEHWYYYDKTGDEDVERAANLGALAKPIRGALKTHKPIFWKKSAYPRSAEEEGTSTTPTAGAMNQSGKTSNGGMVFKDQSFTESQIGPAIISTPSVMASSIKKEMTSATPSASGKKGEKLLKIDEDRIWEETQPEEREKTWDPIGDMDWDGVGSKRKRK